MFDFNSSARARLIALALMGVVCCGTYSVSASAQTPAASTVTVGKFTKKTLGTVTEINSGDVACYISLKDEQGKAFEELADFAICEKPKAYLGKRVSLTYQLDKVMADECQGNPSCKKTKAVALVTSLAVVDAKGTASTPVAAAASSKAQSSFCTPMETVVFACRTGAKMVSVCASKGATRDKGYLQYRFGKPDSTEALELTWPEGEVVANKAATGENVPFVGGGGSWLRFKKGGYGYVVYSGIGKWGPKGETREKQGVVVERDGKVVANLKCARAPDGELGPEWFDKFAVKPKANEDFAFPD